MIRLIYVNIKRSKEKLEKIAAAIQDFEYDEALRLADALREEL